MTVKVGATRTKITVDSDDAVMKSYLKQFLPSSLRPSLAVLLLLASLAGCSPPRDEVVAAFLVVHPGASVLDIAPGEGDRGNVYLHIRYADLGSNAQRQDVWLYQRLNGAWVNTWRRSTGSVKPSG